MDNALETLVAWYATVYNGIGLTWYEGKLASPRWRWSPLVFAAACIAVRLTVMTAVPSYGESSSTAIRVVVILAAQAALAMLLYSSGYRRILYPVLSWTALFELSFFISYTIVHTSSPIYAAVAEAIAVKAPGDVQALSSALSLTAAMIQSLMLICLTAIQILSCRRIVSRIPAGTMSGPEFRLLTLPCAAGLLMVVLLRVLMVTVEAGIPTLLHDRYPSMLLLIPLICGVCLLSIVYAAGTYSDMHRMELELSNGRVAEERLRALKEQVAETERYAHRISKMRHDLRNTLTIVQGLADKSPESSALREYVADMADSVGDIDQPYRTGDPVADVLLSAKFRDLNEQVPDARFDADALVLPPGTGISGYDLGVILGNALDNAIEAVRVQSSGQRYVTMRSVLRGDLLAIYIDNSCEPGTRLSTVSGLPLTTRADGHGIGLANIRDIANKYSGTMDWQMTDGVFKLAVLLKTKKVADPPQ